MCKPLVRSGLIFGLAGLFFALTPLATASADDTQSVSAAEVEQRLAVLDGDKAPEAHQAAMTSLVKLGPGAVPHLNKAMLDPKRSWASRTAAAWVLGELAHETSRDALTKAWKLEKAPGTFKMQIAMALGALGDMEKLRTYLAKDGDKILAAKAATVLANFRDRDSVELMKPLLGDEDIGAFIALALGRLGDGSGKDAVKDLMKEAMFRDYAAVALGGMGDRTVLLPLRFALSNADPFIRRDAARILGNFEDTSALSELEKIAAKDPDVRVREAASRAVKRIERKKRRR